MIDAVGRARAAVEDAIGVNRRLLESTEVVEGVVVLAETIADVLAGGGRVFLFGNGGSAADAQHIAAELVGRFSRDREPLAAEALTVNPSILTAVANDYGFARVFARQLEAGGRPGDVAVAISTSGDSDNVVEAVRAASRLGLRTAALTGATGGRLCGLVERCVRVPSHETPRIQESHILIGHIVCDLVENLLAERRPLS